MSFLDSAATLDPSTTPWAPKVALVAAPTVQPSAPTPVAPPAPVSLAQPASPAQSAQPATSDVKITPETHPHFYEAAKPGAKEPTESGSDYFSTVRRRESGGNDLAWNGTAAGRYQFTPQTWLGVAAAHPELGLRPEDIWSGEKQEIAMRAHTADNARVLQENGLPADPGNLYMMHFLGTGGGPKFLKAMQANPSADAEAMFPLEAKYNSPVFFEKDGHPRTLGQIYGLMTKDFGGQAPPSATSETELQAPQHAALPLIEGRAADVEPELPPPPPGVTLKPLQQTAEQKLPPPPPGVTLKPLTTQDAYEQDLGKTPYEAEAARTEGKPAQSSMSNATQPGQVDDFGRPTNLAPQELQEWNKGETEMQKGVASGLGQSVTGLGELIPGPIGDKSAEATKYLQGVGTPFGQGVGELAGQAAPALMGIGAVGSGARAIAEEGPSMARILSTAGKGAASGAGVGAMTPTGETDTGARLTDKAESAAIGAATGGALGGATPAIGAVLKKAGEIPSLFKSAFGKDAEKAAEELRRGVNAETGKALTEEEKAAKIAQIEKGVEKAKLAEHEQELSRIEKAQQGVAESDRVRVEKDRNSASIEDPEVAAKLKSQVAAKMRDRVRDAERAAREAGQSEAEAKGFAVEQEHRVADAESEAKKIVDTYANKPNIDAKAFGRSIQKTASEAHDKYEKIRSEQSGFGKAIADAGSEPKVRTDKIKTVLDRAEKETANQGTKAILQHIRDEIKTPIRNADGSATVNALSVRKADSLRKTLESAIRNKNMTVANNAAADASEAAYHLAKVRGLLINAAREASPEYGEALNRYRQLSRPLDIFERKGALRSAVEKDALSGDYKMDEARVVGAVLAKTKGGSPALGRLISENPALKNSARLYFNHTLFGFENAPKTPSVKDFETFIRSNKEALEQSGLTREFADLKSARAAGEKAIDEAKQSLSAAEGSVKNTEETKKNALAKIVEERSLSQTAAKREGQVGKNFTQPEDIAKSAAARAKDAEARLKEQIKGSAVRKSETEKNIKDLASKKVQAEAGRRDFKQFQSSIETLPAKNVATAASSAVEKLHTKGYLTDGQLDKFNKQIQDVNKKYGDSDEAKKQLWKILIISGGVGGALGLVGGEGVPLIRHTLPMH